MSERFASCRCGQLTAMAEGDPVRVSVCHCLACQKRTGSALSAQARWEAECVQVEGKSSQWVRTADSGQQTTYHFCPECGSSLQVKLTCTGCGFQPEGAPKFCPECGVKMPFR